MIPSVAVERARVGPSRLEPASLHAETNRVRFVRCEINENRQENVALAAACLPKKINPGFSLY